MLLPPPGFEPMGFHPTENFVGVNGPLYRSIRDGELLLGFAVAPAHANLGGVCHGGMLATLADMQLTLGARHAAGLEVMLPTISLSIEYLSAVPVGAWVEGRTELLRTTRNLVFAQCKLMNGSEIAVRASGILKQGPKVAALLDISRREDEPA